MNTNPCLWNRKPYRPKTMKAMAKEDATKRADGAYRSDIGTRMHTCPQCGSGPCKAKSPKNTK